VKDTRLWIALLALMSFLVGVASSVLHRRLTERPAESGPFGAYADRLVEQFDLSTERAHHLRVVLRDYAMELERVRDARQLEFYASLEQDLRPLGAEYNRIIRDVVLPPEQRPEFDRLAAGEGVPTGPGN